MVTWCTGLSNRHESGSPTITCDFPTCKPLYVLVFYLHDSYKSFTWRGRESSSAVSMILLVFSGVLALIRILSGNGLYEGMIPLDLRLMVLIW